MVVGALLPWCSEGEADDPTEDELYMRSLESRADELSRNLRDIFRERDKLKKDVWIKEKELAAVMTLPRTH